MLTVDFHTHSHFSYCGTHSIVEMLTQARTRGLAALAITDHTSDRFGHIPSPYFDRLVNPVEGIRLLKGVECNVCEEGKIDILPWTLKHLDIVLMGMHPNLPKEMGITRCTELMLACLEQNPCVDIVTHCNDETYRVDFDAIASWCARHGTAVELNNSKTALKRVGDDATRALIAACKAAGCRMAVNSDSHVLNEVGCDEAVRPFLVEADFPVELIVNWDEGGAMGFVEERRGNKVMITDPFLL